VFCVLGTCVRAWKIREPEIAATRKRIVIADIADIADNAGIAVNGERNENTTSSVGLSFIRQPPDWWAWQPRCQFRLGCYKRVLVAKLPALTAMSAMTAMSASSMRFVVASLLGYVNEA
jgi:hypothetical protein